MEILLYITLTVMGIALAFFFIMCYLLKGEEFDLRLYKTKK